MDDYWIEFDIDLCLDFLFFLFLKFFSFSWVQSTAGELVSFLWLLCSGCGYPNSLDSGVLEGAGQSNLSQVIGENRVV